MLHLSCRNNPSLDANPFLGLGIVGQVVPKKIKRGVLSVNIVARLVARKWIKTIFLDVQIRNKAI